MKKQILIGTAAIVLGAAAIAVAHVDAHKLPEGPIRDRHEFMEGIGKSAKAIGDAMKSGKLDPVGPAAEKIHAAAGKALALFPKGSTHEHSRAKAEIWSDWGTFEASMNDLVATSAERAAAAKAGSGAPAAAQKMFATCKACHDKFRLPEKK